MKGFRDFYPEQQRIQNYIFNIWKKIASNYGFEEFSAPILEPVELYKKSGDEIPEQLYTLTDKSKRKLTLRPELTPSLARMINQNPNLPKPIKWFSIPECFRYENIQTGRSRSFFQLNLDTIGTKSMKADAEIIVTSIKIMNAFKLTNKDFYIRISNRKLINDLMNELNIKNTKPIFRIIDKINKIPKKDFENELKKEKCTTKQIKEINRLLKITDLKYIKSKSQGLKEIKELFTYLNQFGVSKYCKLDLSIMRGFDYYTSTIFEVFDKTLKFRALAGGGRYDNLANQPGIGYGMGDLVLELFLKEKNKLPELKNDLDYYIICVNNKIWKTGIKIAESLRKNYKVDIDLNDRNLKKQFKYANIKNAKNVIIIGSNELKKNQIRIKNMKTGKESLKSIKLFTNNMH